MTRDICIALGERLRELRRKRGWRQIDLAEHAGIHENYVSDLESGRKEICLRTLQTVASAFGLKVTELVEGLD